jgi:predicted DNA binding CopG/RHH family protein
MRKKKIGVDFSQLEPVDQLTEEEQAWHNALRSRKLEFHGDAKTIQKYAEIFKQSRKERKAISLRIPTQDYFAIKAKAANLGLPYQALINSLIHQYINGQLKGVLV